MRPASPPGANSPDQGSPNGPTTDPSAEDGEGTRSRGRRWPWVVLGLGVAVAIAAGAMVVATRNRTPASSHPQPSTPSGSPRPPFAFAEATVKAQSLRGGGNRKAAVGVADQIRGSLSAFYQAAFVDPRAWTGAVPAQAWTAFAPATRRQAQGDAASLTLGTVSGKITSFPVTDSSLTVTVLFDGHGRPQAAFADVSFQATPLLEGGEGLRVTNHVQFYLQLISGSWLITGYPSARTALTAPASSAGPTPSPTGPTPTAS
jgi:hypothetical protein